MPASTQPRFVKCPTCGQPVAWTTEQAFRPFCSERCKMCDFGEWVMEEKKIAGESVLLDLDNVEANLWQ